jgi:hypothetical protein
MRSYFGISLGDRIHSNVARVYSCGNHIAEFLRQRRIAATVGMYQTFGQCNG